MDKELELKIKSLKQKTFYEPVAIKNIDTSNEDVLIISGYANKFKDVSGQVIKDSDGDSVVPSGIDLSRYSKNPIILLNHNRNDIIGRATSVEVKDDGLYIEANIYKSLNEKAYKAVKLGVLKSFSIGFTIEDLTYDEKSDIFFLTKTSLMENSVVSLPSNEDSLITSVDEKLGVSGKALRNLKVKSDEPKVTLEELKESITMLHKQISELQVKNDSNEETEEVPSGTEDTDTEGTDSKEEVPANTDKTEPEGAEGNKEEAEKPVVFDIAEEVGKLEVTESTFDVLLEVQEALTERLNNFLHNTLH